MDPGDDEEFDRNDFDETRVELHNLGHNLTSVLMNPRETMLEDIFDPFTTDQSVPVTLATINSSSSSSTSSSASSMLSMSSSSSHHSMSSSTGKSSSTSRVTSTWASSLLLAITKSEEEQLKSSIKRMQSIYKDYNRIHASSMALSNNNKQTTSKQSKFPQNGATSVRASGGGEDIFSCFREVPEVFLRQDFTLANVDIFNQTMGTPSNYRYQSRPIEDINNHTSGPTRRDRNKTMDSPPGEFLKRMLSLIPQTQQDKLTKYLDQIELGLLRQIWVRSSAFFGVLDDVRALETLVMTVYRHISDVRKKLLSVGEQHSVTIMRIPRLYVRHKNESVLIDKLSSMQKVLSGKSAIQAMVEIEDYLGALEIIAEVRQLYHDELEGITCLKKIGSQLDDYDNFICEVMCNKFVSIAIQWDDTTFGESEDSTGSYAAVIGEGKDSFEQLLKALMTVDRLKPALNMYKNRLSESIRLIVRTCVLEYLTSFDPTLVVEALDFSSQQASDQAESNNTPFAQRVRGMTPENFISCISMCFEHVLIALERAESVHRYVEIIMTKCANEIPDKVQVMYVNETPVQGEGEGDGKVCDAATKAMITLSKSSLTTACDIAQRSIAQLLSLRKDSNTRISIDKMKFLWEISVHFISSIESLMGASVYVMRQSLLNQTKVYLDQSHEGYKAKLVNTLDSERWMQCDVSPERQAELERLVSGKSFLQSKPKDSSSIAVSAAESQSLADPGIGGAGGARKKELRPVIIEGSVYNVVWSVLLLSEVCMVYLDVAVSFPNITTEIISKIVELVRLFDSRSRQLVLGAQAIQSAARLKSISAKHLSITAQSVGLVSALLPHIRAALLSQLPPKHQLLLTEFDRVSHELIDHHGQIVAKFVSIVGDSVEASSGRLRSIDWDRFQGQCEYFDEVQKNVAALHRVLSSILPPEQVQDVFSRIFSLLSRKIPSHFEEIMPSTQTGRQRILDEISHLVTSFSQLRQVDSKVANNTLEEAFRKRYGYQNHHN